MMKDGRVSPRHIVVIPAYNEESSIEELVTAVREYSDVVVVNDGSRDKTGEIIDKLKSERVAVIHHQANTHIPGAIKDGFEYALENGYDYAITMDAGFSHSPDELPRFVEKNDSDLVLSHRVERYNIPLYRKAISRVGCIMINYAVSTHLNPFSGQKFRDVTSGYRKYSRRAMEAVVEGGLVSRSFDFHFEALHKVCKKNLTISEVPISYHFTNSSLNRQVIKHSLNMWMRLLRRKARLRRRRDFIS